MARPKLTEQRRLQALQAAVEVIGKRGLCDTRITDIAERARLSPGLLLYYFESKDRLLTEALAFAEDRFYLDTFHELTGITDPVQRLVTLVERSCPNNGADGDQGDWPLWVELWGRARRDPEAARKREALDRRWRTIISDIVRDGERIGVFESVDAEDFALLFAALIDGLAIQVLLGDPDVTSTRMKNLVLQLAARELGVRFESLVGPN
jgi:TetR/AcrR family transcriptional repressor of bet genes